jgi:hypothetical protein
MSTETSISSGLAARHNFWTSTILSLLMAFASVSTDIYLPAMPTMASSLHASAGGIEVTLFISCTGLITANSITGALHLFPEVAGSVSALVGAGQFSSGILVSALVGLFANGTLWPLGGSTAFFGLGCTLCAVLLVRTPLHG